MVINLNFKVAVASKNQRTANADSMAVAGSFRLLLKNKRVLVACKPPVQQMAGF